MKRRFLILAICFLNFLRSDACTVPVFRYALEQWPQDPYRMFLFVDGKFDSTELTAAQNIAAKAIDVTGKISYLGNYKQLPVRSNFNLDIISMNDTLNLNIKKLLSGDEKPALPFAIMMFPDKMRSNQIIFKGPIKNVPSELFDSPARSTIQNRIARGESVVWILLESGDKKKDSAAASVLQKEVEECKSEIKLANQDSSELAKLVAGSKLELKIDFSMFKVSRSDPKEKYFISMLEKTELQLAHFAGEPIAYPIFARGRVLYALVGKGINKENIFDAASFLTGPCACTVKDQNPGADLLMTFDWDAMLKGKTIVKESTPPLVGIGSLLSASSHHSDSTIKSTDNKMITVNTIKSDSLDTNLIPPKIKSSSGTCLIIKTNNQVESKKKQDPLIKGVLYPFAGICIFGFLFISIVSIRMNRKKSK